MSENEIDNATTTGRAAVMFNYKNNFQQFMEVAEKNLKEFAAEESKREAIVARIDENNGILKMASFNLYNMSAVTIEGIKLRIITLEKERDSLFKQ